MFLKTLTLKGFKSFAEVTALEMEPGVTVVVGPNGSGKSNVVDAIGWVLGAQAPSAVRSQKMDDVIFAGTAKRPALGRAEVSLTIDNSAGLLPIDFSEVTLTRTLWRSGDSEYSINGTPCRLLDIQELLSDSGVGRQQHVIVSQGQIDAVLNARPEDRRLVIEEAAGVLKFRRRKEKAERRLAATEANLTRLHDLLREVRRQLRPLERQAAAARRHGGLVSELGALRLHLAGVELRRLRERAAKSERDRTELITAEAQRRQALTGLDESVLTTEARLTALGGDDLGDDLARCEALRERARGLAALLAERRRGLDRERGAQVDQTVIASLEAEAARLADELTAVDGEAARLAPEAQRLAAAEADLTRERADFDGTWGGATPVPGGEAAETRGELGAVRAAVERTASEVARVESAVAAIEDKAARLTVEAERLRTEAAEADRSEASLVASVDAAEADLAVAEARLAAADEAHRRLDADGHGWAARVEALELALGEARLRAGTERLTDLEGFVGTLLDVVEIDDGWEAAFEAAAGAAILAVVVDGVEVARRALDSLGSAGLTGSVVALGAGRPPPVAAPARAGAERLRPHVRSSRPGVDALLDALVGDVAAVDAWPDAVDLALAHPGATIVSRAGDRVAPDGWRIGGGGTGATGAALDEARERAEKAAAAATGAAGDTASARRARDEARLVAADLSRRLDRNDGRLTAAGDALTRVEADRRDVATEHDALRAHEAELQERAGRERTRHEELEARLVDLEAVEQAEAERVGEVTAARARIEALAARVDGLRRDIEVRAAGVEERREFLQGRRGEVEERLVSHQSARDEAAGRRVALDRQVVAVERFTEIVDDRLRSMEVAVADLRERRQRQSEAARAVATELDRLRSERTVVEKALGEVRERLSRSEIDRAEIAVRIESAVEALRRDHDVEPEVAMAAPAPELPEGISAPAKVRDLERELRLLGPINPLALEEHTALQERHEHLEEQLDDVKAARRDLSKVVRAVDAEIVSVFASAYADVEANFGQLFETLFPDGLGRLTLNRPDDLLNTGVEIEAKPSGKNVKKLSLLSGGERSLTALAYLFAVFRARPSPFYVMDEVEAALDDVNLHRFLGLVQEFRDEAQLLIVSHQKRTMEAADLLYGVTMAPGGTSQVLAEKAGATI